MSGIASAISSHGASPVAIFTVFILKKAELVKLSEMTKAANVTQTPQNKISSEMKASTQTDNILFTLLLTETKTDAAAEVLYPL